MEYFTIQCEAVKISNESGICPGSAKCRTGENLYFDSKNAGTHGDVWSCIRCYSSDGICYAVVRKDGLGET